jgi:hypothetical protein
MADETITPKAAATIGKSQNYAEFSSVDSVNSISLFLRLNVIQPKLFYKQQLHNFRRILAHCRSQHQFVGFLIGFAPKAPGGWRTPRRSAPFVGQWNSRQRPGLRRPSAAFPQRHQARHLCSLPS